MAPQSRLRVVRMLTSETDDGITKAVVDLRGLARMTRQGLQPVHVSRRTGDSKSHHQLVLRLPGPLVAHLALQSGTNSKTRRGIGQAAQPLGTSASLRGTRVAEQPQGLISGQRHARCLPAAADQNTGHHASSTRLHADVLTSYQSVRDHRDMKEVMLYDCGDRAGEPVTASRPGRPSMSASPPQPADRRTSPQIRTADHTTTPRPGGPWPGRRGGVRSPTATRGVPPRVTGVQRRAASRW